MSSTSQALGPKEPIARPACSVPLTGGALDTTRVGHLSTLPAGGARLPASRRADTPLREAAAPPGIVGPMPYPAGLAVDERPPPDGWEGDDGPTVVLVHGILDRGSSFSRTIRRLAGMGVVTYDRRGYQRSREGLRRSASEGMWKTSSAWWPRCPAPPGRSRPSATAWEATW